MRWLGTEQALADAAFFVRAMSDKYNLDKAASRWVSFGGSCDTAFALCSHRLHG